MDEYSLSSVFFFMARLKHAFCDGKSVLFGVTHTRHFTSVFDVLTTDVINCAHPTLDYVRYHALQPRVARFSRNCVFRGLCIVARVLNKILRVSHRSSLPENWESENRPIINLLINKASFGLHIYAMDLFHSTIAT